MSADVPRWHPEHPAASNPAVRAFLDAADADRAEYRALVAARAMTAFYALFATLVVALVVLSVAAAVTGTRVR